ncbi:MAG TPA: hypothetical protein VFZ61_12345 [Polyangiales bacterium]
MKRTVGLTLPLLSGTLFFALGACAEKPLTPTIESSAEESSYAVAYPPLLEERRKQLVADKTQATELTAKVRDHDIKSNADPKLLEEIVESADTAGRSSAFVAAQREARAFRAFWDEERGAIGARVAAAANKQVADAGCGQAVDVSGATSYALREGFDRQLEKRVREHNEAQHVIDRERTALGGAGTKEMEEFADQIAYASYLVHVGLVDDKQQIEGMLEERRSVSSTLDSRLKAEQEYLAQAKTKEDKKASEERIGALNKSRSAIDTAATDAEAEVKELDQTIRQARADYDDALEAQLKRIKERPEPVASK